MRYFPKHLLTDDIKNEDDDHDNDDDGEMETIHLNISLLNNLHLY